MNWERAEKLGEIWRKNALDVIPNKNVKKGGKGSVKKNKLKRKS